MAILLENPANIRCVTCGRAVRPGEQFQGPRMWHQHVWVCGHEVTFECHECYYADPPAYAKCSVCGCGGEYC